MIRVTWYDQARTTVLWTFESRFSAQDFHLALYSTRALAGERHFDVIADMRQVVAVPARAIQLLRTAHADVPANYGLTVVVDPMPFVRAILSVAGRSSDVRGRLAFASSRAQAEQILRCRREVNDPLEAATQPV